MTKISEAVEAALDDLDDPDREPLAAVARRIAAAMDDPEFPAYSLDRLSRELRAVLAALRDAQEYDVPDPEPDRIQMLKESFGSNDSRPSDGESIAALLDSA